MKRFIFALTLMLFSITLAYSQTSVEIYSGYWYNLQTDKHQANVNDVFITYSNSSAFPHWTGLASVRYNPASNLSLYNAWINYRLGMSETTNLFFTLGKRENTYYTLTDRTWGNYFISPVLSDNLIPRTDIGVSVALLTGKLLVSGEVSNHGSDSIKAYTGTANLRLGTNASITGVIYNFFDYSVFGGSLNANKVTKNISINANAEGLVSQQTETETVGETVFSTRLQRLNISGSVEVGFPRISKQLSLVGRYEGVQNNLNNATFENGDVVVNKFTYAVIAGLNWTPVSNVKVGINWRGSSDGNVFTNNSINLNTKIVFGADNF